ncbi:FMN reductase [Flexivirga endophytica]|uniref:FMN reductase n=1 Tax=Flexivirga endophytica TaxID=1849103 RepID=A0A916WVK8_9MICO|nr:NAD(P)H-dependent oxidoreductase [Flexivirga endophytica]GGB36070.1 FMN reductase [Flexivirga endophytica]GHB43827.1 FMN reductase [Flexivirga endophytica]
MKIGIILGSVRDSRKGELVADWVRSNAEETGGAEFEVLDLRDFQLPLLTSAVLPSMAGRNYDSPEVTRWSEAIDACDGYVMITPEYNHGVPGALKNAVDSLGPEWTGKTIGFVSYGADGGVRAVEQWRQIVANFHMIDVRHQVSLQLFTEFGEGGLQLQDRRAGEIKALLDALVTLTGRLQAA